jgi:hypothetical protein
MNKIKDIQVPLRAENILKNCGICSEERLCYMELI